MLISDLFEGGNAEEMLARVARLKQAGVNVIVLLALSDRGSRLRHPPCRQDSRMDCPVFACTPEHFPALMAAR